MNRLIYKYGLKKGEQTIVVQCPIKIMKFGAQAMSPVVWIEIDPTQDIQVALRFYLYFTGEPFDRLTPEGYLKKYVGTAETLNGLVYHCYRVRLNKSDYGKDKKRG